MKKIFLIALAAIGMTACMQEEVMDTPTGGAITFDKAFVGNATKAVVTTDNLEDFKVWGYVNQPSGKLFEGTVVKKKGDAWTYDGTQYWAPENEYHFAAIAPVSSQWDLNAYPGTLTFENDGTTDLIYAAKQVTSATAGNTNSAVAFEFDHLLSKVKLNFTNGFPTENVTVALTEIKMATPQTAEMAIASGEACVWANFGANKDFTFTDKELASAASATTEEYFILPYDAVISFKVNVLVGDHQPVSVYTGVKTATLPAATFEMGHAYNLSAVINADALNFDEIEFTVNQVDAWDEAPNTSDAAANLIYAAQIGGTYKLTDNAVLDAPVVVPANVNLVLDLNGKTITTELKQEGRHHYAIDNYGTLTLKNGTIIARGVENFGTMVIEEGVTITNIDTNGGSAIWNEGDLVINGGTFTTNAEAGVGSYGSALNTQKGGTAVVNGGNFVANSQLTYAICNYGETVINNATVVGKHGAVAAAEGAEIKTVINGGSFSLNENPAVSDHCVYYVSEIKGGTFTLGNNTDGGAQVFYDSTIAEGYTAKENNGIYTVVYDTVSTAEQFKTKVEAGVANIALEGGVVIDIADEVVYIKNNIKISSPADNKATLKGKFVAEGDYFTATNVKFAANAQTAVNLNTKTYGTYVVDGYSAIITLHYSAGTFENCEFDGASNHPAINYFMDAADKVLNVSNCTFTDTFIYSKVLCNIDNNTFNCGDYIPYPICVWPRPAGSTNSKCYFVNNTVSSNYYPAEHKGHCLIMLLSQSTPYANLEFNVQGNTVGATKYTWGWVAKAEFAKDGSVTFAEGSATVSL